MGSFTHIDTEQQWANKFKTNEGAAWQGPGWYSKDTGLKDEPTSKSLENSPAMPGFVSGRGLKRPDGFNDLLKEMKKKTMGHGINTN